MPFKTHLFEWTLPFVVLSAALESVLGFQLICELFIVILKPRDLPTRQVWSDAT